MSEDYLGFGTTPIAENCAQLHCDNYRYSEYLKRARQEARAFIEGIKKTLNPPDSVYFRICTCPHDFGSYIEVRMYWENEEGEEWVYNFESHEPETWEDIGIDWKKVYTDNSCYEGENHV